jgi:hypothetical protein
MMVWFPGNRLLVLHYKQVLIYPFFSLPRTLKNFLRHMAGRTAGMPASSPIIITIVLGIYSGSAMVQLGGDSGPIILLEKRDVLVIPAGVAHRNLDREDAVGVVGAFANGRHYDTNYGKPGERPQAV